MKILVTGGAGYIGSHTCIELIKEGYDVIVIDNLINSSEESLKRVEKISNKTIPFYKIDVLDELSLTKVFLEHSIDAVIHFAGLKAIGESTQNPIKYFNTNVGGSIVLTKVMAKFNCKKIIFSSTATVYEGPHSCGIKENHPLGPSNPYSRSKLMFEEILNDLFLSDKTWQIAILRYFNPIGAHKSGLIGEDPFGIPNNLFPYIAQVAIGKLKMLKIFGDDYDTLDGTGVRDYIHVVDLAKGHIKALKAIDSKPQLITVNLGTGISYSVLDIVSAFEKASGKKIPYQIVDRRLGDISAFFADPSLAKEKLGWIAKYDLNKMCADTWRWQSLNPHGYLTDK